VAERALRVLVTNISLAGRSGTEFFTRDLAHGLRATGHVPVVYTPDPGSVADEIRAAGIEVVCDLDRLSEPPDIIHGHHAGPAMESVIRFAGVPAVFVVHDRTAWHDEPPRHPRIRRYVAVDANCAERLDGLPDCVIHNAVDLDRFRARGPLPDRPRTALLLSNHADEGVAARVREACARHGVRLDAMGLQLGGMCEHPEAVLGSYDLVFGKARCALEALAVGCAVVVCDVTGLGGLVTPADFAHMRHLNFGARTLADPLTADALAREIARYDPAACAEVSARARAEAGLVDHVARFVALYREVLAEPRDAEPEGPAVARFVHSQHRALFDTMRLAAENRALWRERGELERRLRVSEPSRTMKLHARLLRLFARRDDPDARRLPPTPVIVGVPRSGTTLLRLMLDSHPRLAVPPETGWLAAVDPSDRADALIARIVSAPQWPDFHLSREALEAAVRGVRPFRIGDGVRAFYRLYAARFGKDRWGEKTPDYGPRMEAIERLLPEARFIHLVRDGRDVAASVRHLWFRPGDTMEEIARDWCGRIRATRAQRVRHMLEVRYEELVREPEAVLRRICSFVELPFDGAMLDYHRRAPERLAEHEARPQVTKEQRLKQQEAATRPPDPSLIGRWRRDLTREDAARFDHVAGALLRELGYRE